MVEDNPGYVVYNRLMRMLYEFNPIRDQVAGSIESIAEITAETLYNCHKAFYAPSNMTLCVAGDCDPEEVFAIADELLPREKAEIPKADMGQAESEKPIKSYNEEQMEVSAVIKVYQPEKGRLEDFDSLCLSLADGVFGNYCALDAFEVLGSVSKNECEDFLKAFMTPDRLAMSVISPVKA